MERRAHGCGTLRKIYGTFSIKWQLFSIVVLTGGNISQNFSEIIFDFLIFQFSEKSWEIFQISL